MAFYSATRGTPDVLPPLPDEIDDTELVDPNENISIENAARLALAMDTDMDTRGRKIPRIVRMRIVEAALEEARLKEVDMADWKEQEKFVNKSFAKARKGQLHELGMSQKELLILGSPLKWFRYALDYAAKEEQKGKAARHIPDRIIEKAFEDLDVGEKGEITMVEFRCALKVCGINTNKDAMDAIMDEMDSDGNGVIDIEEFSKFFHLCEDLLVTDAEVKTSALITRLFCTLCLISNVMGLSFMSLEVIRGAKGILIDIALQGFMVSIPLLCWCVIGLPLLRALLGRKPDVWGKYIMRWIRRTRTWQKTRFQELSEKAKRLVGRGSKVEPGRGSIDESLDVEGQKIAWAAETSSRKTKKQRKTAKLSVKSSKSGTPLKNSTKKNSEAPRESEGARDLEEGEDDSDEEGMGVVHMMSAEYEEDDDVHTSRTSAKSKKGTAKKKKSSDRRKSIDDRSFLNRVLPWRKSKKQSKRGGGGSTKSDAEKAQEEAYSPASYKDANFRAFEASERALTSFSLMQVRNLERPPVPEEVQVGFTLSRSASLTTSSATYRKASYSSNYSYPASLASSSGFQQAHDGWEAYPDLRVQAWSGSGSPVMSPGRQWSSKSQTPAPTDEPQVFML